MKKNQEDSKNENEMDDHISLPETSKEEEEAFASAEIQPKKVLITDEELRKLQQEVFEFKDKYLRLLADGENSRKRLQKEKQELSRHAIENLMIDFLQPLDNLENALRFAQEMSDEVRNWAFGFQMILTQFKDILSQNGVMSFDSVGRPFNPHDHEAIEMVETADQPPGIIIEENVRGYRMGDRTIRAARVKVAKAP
ncbi:MAG: nucleotide exchange factor GrpE [Parachlamydiaceae bacterium]